MRKIIFVTSLFLGVCISAQARTYNVAFLIFDDMNVMDYAGPLEVFHQSSNVMKEMKHNDYVKVYTVAHPQKKIRALERALIEADYTIDNAPMADIVIVAGGDVRKIQHDKRVQRWLQAHHYKNKVIMSVCTGSIILARAGLLDGKSATTHHMAFSYFAEHFPQVELVRGVKFIDEGNLMTTAGVVTGIDGALHLVSREFGAEVAAGAAKIMEYAP